MGRLEGQLAQIDNTLTTIEFQKESLMNARANAEILSTMKTAGNAMKTIHKEVGGIAKIEDIMADIEESNMIAGEISEAISRPIGTMDDFDEDDLMAELEDLEQEDLDDNLITAGVSNIQMPSLPAVPQNNLPQVEGKQKEEDLEDLANWVGI